MAAEDAETLCQDKQNLGVTGRERGAGWKLCQRERDMKIAELMKNAKSWRESPSRLVDTWKFRQLWLQNANATHVLSLRP